MGKEYTESQARADLNYKRNKVDVMHISVPKGKRDEYKTIAVELGYPSLNQFVVDSIERRINEEKSVYKDENEA